MVVSQPSPSGHRGPNQSTQRWPVAPEPGLGAQGPDGRHAGTVSRFEEWARKKRELLTSVMEHAGLKRLVEPDFTVRAADTAGAAGALMSTDRDFIPKVLDIDP